MGAEDAHSNSIVTSDVATGGIRGGRRIDDRVRVFGCISPLPCTSATGEDVVGRCRVLVAFVGDWCVVGRLQPGNEIAHTSLWGWCSRRRSAIFRG